MSRTSRNYGIDLLRVFSMFLVAIIHILGHGGVIRSATSFGNIAVIWLLEILAFPAVNCFMLISGFVGYRNEIYAPKLRNIISIFITVLFYSVGICCLLQLIEPNLVNLTDIKNSFLPLIKKQYWFYSSYFGVFLLSPIINSFVYKASQKQLYLSLLIVFFFSFLTLETDAFIFNDGYSLIWLALLYLVGAIIKKLDITSLISAKFCVLMLLITFTCTYIPQVVFPMTKNSFLLGHTYYFTTYDSPTVLLMAIAWLCLFSKLNFNSSLQKIISFFSTSAFSVYLIHDNRHIRKIFITDAFTFVNEYNPIILVLIVLGVIIAILISCTLIDKIRILLFRIFKVDNISIFIERIVKSTINKLYNKVCSKSETAR